MDDTDLEIEVDSDEEVLVDVDDLVDVQVEVIEVLDEVEVHEVTVTVVVVLKVVDDMVETLVERKSVNQLALQDHTMTLLVNSMMRLQTQKGK